MAILKAKILYGSEVVAKIDEQTKRDISFLNKNDITPCLAILRIGMRPDDISYEKTAIKRCEKLGIAVKKVLLCEDVSHDQVMQNIIELNNDKNVHGILMFRPMPKHINEEACCKAIDPLKDIDAANPMSSASAYLADQSFFAPCTAQACMEILNYYGIDPAGKKAVVIGRSLVVGKPVAMLLLSANATVTICHTKTKDIESVVRDADIVVAASGNMESIGNSYLRKDQIVIDVGISWNDEKQKLCGDVIFDEAESICNALTPVPGGVGTVTTSVMLGNVVKSVKRGLV